MYFLFHSIHVVASSSLGIFHPQFTPNEWYKVSVCMCVCATLSSVWLINHPQIHQIFQLCITPKGHLYVKQCDKTGTHKPYIIFPQTLQTRFFYFTFSSYFGPHQCFLFFFLFWRGDFCVTIFTKNCKRRKKMMFLRVTLIPFY